MSASLTFDLDGIAVMHIRGMLKRADLAPCEKEIGRLIDSGKRPLLLVILENFGGWQRGDDWVNADFLFTHGDNIAKMAIVGGDHKTDEVKSFTGAGLRPTPVEFFAIGDQSSARAWLLQ